MSFNLKLCKFKKMCKLRRFLYVTTSVYFPSGVFYLFRRTSLLTLDGFSSQYVKTRNKLRLIQKVSMLSGPFSLTGNLYLFGRCQRASSKRTTACRVLRPKQPTERTAKRTDGRDAGRWVDSTSVRGGL